MGRMNGTKNTTTRRLRNETMTSAAPAQEERDAAAKGWNSKP